MSLLLRQLTFAHMQFRERGGHPCLCTNCEPPLFILQQLKDGNNGKLASILDVICFSLDSREWPCNSRGASVERSLELEKISMAGFRERD